MTANLITILSAAFCVTCAFWTSILKKSYTKKIFELEKLLLEQQAKIDTQAILLKDKDLSLNLKQDIVVECEFEIKKLKDENIQYCDAILKLKEAHLEFYKKCFTNEKLSLKIKS